MDTLTRYKVVGIFLALTSLTALAAAPFPGAAPRPAGPWGTPPSALLEAKLGGTDFRPGEPIPLELTLKNVSAETIYLWDTNPEIDFEISLRGPGGARLPLSEYAKGVRMRSENGVRRETLAVGPGEKRQFRVDVGRLFDIRKAGLYSIVFSRTFFLRGGDSRHGVSSPAVNFRLLKPLAREKRRSG